MLLFRKYYAKTKRTLKRLKKWDKDKIQAYHFEKLKDLLTYAYENVPYYKKTFDEVNFHPKDFKRIEDLLKIPCLTKDIIRENRDELTSRSVPEKYHKYTKSGGTTGMPFEFILDKRTSSPVEFANIQYIWKKVGYKFYDRCVVLRADVPKKIVEGEKYWEHNLTNNWLAMSAHHLTRDTFEVFYNRIKKFKPKFIIAYPSVVYALAKYLKQKNLKLPSVKAIICSSETLYKQHREFLTAVFNIPVYAYYGLSEKCCIAGECDNNEYYKFVPTYGFAEVVNEENKWCTKEGESGEIIATSYNNYAFPFIRYKTQDIGIHSNFDDGTPGWQVLSSIQGRIQEFLIDNTNSLISFTCTDEVFWHVINKVNAYQYVQDKPGKIKLLIDCHDETLTEEEISEAKKIFFSYYKGFELDIQYVDKIPRTSSGKFRYLIQNLPPQ